MRKRFAPLALLFGLLTAMMLASTPMAQANSIKPNFVCTNSPTVNVVTCIDVLNDIKITIQTDRALTNNELRSLEHSLNDIEICRVTIQEIKVLVVNVYHSFNPPITTITVDNVTVRIVSMICY